MNNKQAAKMSRNLRTSEIWCGKNTPEASYSPDLNQQKDKKKVRSRKHLGFK